MNRTAHSEIEISSGILVDQEAQQKLCHSLMSLVMLAYERAQQSDLEVLYSS